MHIKTFVVSAALAAAAMSASAAFRSTPSDSGAIDTRVPKNGIEDLAPMAIDTRNPIGLPSEVGALDTTKPAGFILIVR